uniref:Uncharacterized protein n=1 Tax=Setaria italica TaxID=4555 RepID=K3ZGE1_SETIT
MAIHYIETDRYTSLVMVHTEGCITCVRTISHNTIFQLLFQSY